MQPRTERSRLGNIVRPWNKMNVVEMDVNEDVRVGKELFVKDGVHTNWIKPDKQLTIPAGLLVDTVVGEDAVWSEQVSERVTAFFASFDQTQVFQSVSIGHVKPGKDGTKLYVDGNTILADELDVFGETIVRNAFTSEGETTLGGETFHTTVRGELQVDKDATFDENFETKGDVLLSREDKKTTVRGELTVNGKVKINDSIELQSGASIAGEVLLGSEEETTTVQGPLIAHNLITKYITSDVPIKVPFGIITGSFVASDAVFENSASDNVVAFHGNFDTVHVAEKIWIAKDDPDPAVDSALYVDGSIHCTGQITELSDARYKSSFEPLHDALEKVCRMRGLTFQKPLSDDPARRYMGLLAQEIQPIVPEVVFSDKEESGTLGVAYGHIVPLLIESIKELRSIVEEQRNDIERLRSSA